MPRSVKSRKFSGKPRKSRKSPNKPRKSPNKSRKSRKISKSPNKPRKSRKISKSPNKPRKSRKMSNKSYKPRKSPNKSRKSYKPGYRMKRFFLNVDVGDDDGNDNKIIKIGDLEDSEDEEIKKDVHIDSNFLDNVSLLQDAINHKNNNLSLMPKTSLIGKFTEIPIINKDKIISKINNTFSKLDTDATNELKTDVYQNENECKYLGQLVDDDDNRRCIRLGGDSIEGVTYDCTGQLPENDPLKIVKKYNQISPHKTARIKKSLNKLNHKLRQNTNMEKYFSNPRLFVCDHNKVYEKQSKAGISIEKFLENKVEEFERDDYKTEEIVHLLRDEVIKIINSFVMTVKWLSSGDQKLYHNDTHGGNVLINIENGDTPVLIDYGYMTYDYPLDKDLLITDKEQFPARDIALFLATINDIYQKIVKELTGKYEKTLSDLIGHFVKYLEIKRSAIKPFNEKLENIGVLNSHSLGNIKLVENT